MDIDVREIKKAKEEIAKLGDGELEMLERIAFEEIIKREAKKIILRLIDQQK